MGKGTSGACVWHPGFSGSCLRTGVRPARLRAQLGISECQALGAAENEELLGVLVFQGDHDTAGAPEGTRD